MVDRRCGGGAAAGRGAGQPWAGSARPVGALGDVMLRRHGVCRQWDRVCVRGRWCRAVCGALSTAGDICVDAKRKRERRG